MPKPPDRIASRSFVPRKLPGLVWRGLHKVAPAAANRYFDYLIRDQVRRSRGRQEIGGLPLTVVGSFALNIGIAKAAQALCLAMKDGGVPVHQMDCSAVLRLVAGPRAPRPSAPVDGTMVFCVNPPEMRNVLRHFGPRICRGKRLIGYWWWELDQLPRAWLPWIDLMDEIWVSSRFVHETFSRALPDKPVRYVPLPVTEPAGSGATRADFGLNVGRFTVLAAFDLSSHWARKNPDGAIAAFRRAFSPGEAQLVLKVSGAERHPSQMRQLRALIADLPDAAIIDRPLSDGDLAALVKCADVFLSLHRSEGLGLFIAEAMWLGTPVIATGWSGVMDMLDAENAMLVRFEKVRVHPAAYPSVPPGAQWAEPNIEHAADCLRQLANDSALGARLATKGRERAEQLFSLARFRALAPTLLEPYEETR